MRNDMGFARSSGVAASVARGAFGRKIRRLIVAVHSQTRPLAGEACHAQLDAPKGKDRRERTGSANALRKVSLALYLFHGFC
ncbi:MAG: hypothetical protein ACI9IV_001776 [Paracoccaceae bacterium]|jgi:hypothetical protein